ncbi:MAG: DUF4345 domain-containing protein [Saccharospirillaceae bacterium]|nr:DUF4345 domain-containing protein [Pseudomonadales bacterium]NRB77467.1 DUF4345 domain-containing protein [Saccharospirillaceae bacterium]
MKNSKILKGYLIISGLLLAYFGAAILLIPIELKASFDIIIPNDMNVLNDMRAFSMLTLMIGLFTVFASFKKQFTYSATLIVSVQFLALGCGRLVSVVIDGMPVEGNIIGMCNELFLGVVGLILFFIYKNKTTINH